IGSGLLRLLVGGGGSVAEDEAGGALPVGGGGDVASVDQQLDTGHLGSGQLTVLGVVGLDHRQVRGFAEMVGVAAERRDLGVVVVGVVDGALGAMGAQRLDHGEDPGEGGLLVPGAVGGAQHHGLQDRKSTRLNSSHVSISYAVFCLKKKKQN